MQFNHMRMDLPNIFKNKIRVALKIRFKVEQKVSKRNQSFNTGLHTTFSMS